MKIHERKINWIVLLLAAFVLCTNAIAQISFVNVQPEIGQAFGRNANTSTWGDVDNDGDLDIYVCSGDTNGLYMNDLDVSGRFILADETVIPLIMQGGPRSVIMGDIDNDDDLDICCVMQENRVYLLINQLSETGTLSFVDIAEDVGMALEGMRYYSATMADYNNDTYLDIMITGLANAGWVPTVLFKNLGIVDGQLAFQEVADESGIYSVLGMEMMGSVWGDYDNDGDQDIFIPTYPTYPAFLYSNNGDATFTDVTVETGIENSLGSSRGSDFIDYDNDGDLDVYITRVKYADRPNMDTCQLLRNDNGVFVDVPSAQVVARTIRGMAWVDYDNDGDPDLHLVEEGGRDILFRNDGNDIFVDVAEEVGLLKTVVDGWPVEMSTRGGQTWADWDADGDLDLILPSYSYPYLMRNDGGNSNNWLEIKLKGVLSNRSAAGARVIAVAQDLKQMREVHIGSGYLTGPPLDVHLGFGQRTNVDSLIVRWSRGTIDVLTDVEVNQIISIEEGSAPTIVASNSTILPAEFGLEQNYPNPFNPVTTIDYCLSRKSRVELAVYDLGGRKIRTLVSSAKEPGSHSAIWNGCDSQGKFVASGIYFYRLTTDRRTLSRKMTLLK